jgi:hypothetical protein
MEFLTPSEKQPSLEEVQAQFEQWRRSRGKRRAIPASLWEAASSLYPAYSLHRISKTLRLNYTKLKHYVQGPFSDLSMADGEAFIEMGFATPAPDRPCVVEMRHCNGSRMTVQGADSQDLMKLARLFWSRP